MLTTKRDPESYDPRESYAAKQLSRYDMQIAGIVVYVVTMTMFFIVALVMMLFRDEPSTHAHVHAAKPVIAAVAAPSAGSQHGKSTLAVDRSER